MLCELFFLGAEAFAGLLFFLFTTCEVADAPLLFDFLSSRPVSTIVAAAVASEFPTCTMLPAMPPTFRASFVNKGFFFFLGAGVFVFIRFSSGFVDDLPLAERKQPTERKGRLRYSDQSSELNYTGVAD